MIGLIQRVSTASVSVDDITIGKIDQGILLLLGVEKNDDEKIAQRLVDRVLGYRIFEDKTGRMNLSLKDIQGELLVISQFTLPADTRKGTRPSFTPAAEPVLGKQLYEFFITQAKLSMQTVQSGEFGADMQVSLINNGPVTFWLQAS